MRRGAGNFRTIYSVLAVLMCFLFAQEITRGDGPKPEAADTKYTEFDGAETIDLEPGKSEITIDGKNLTRQKIYDFTLELKGCKDKAKFKRIKVQTSDNKGRLTDTSDWDVDDNMDGNSQGDWENRGSGFSNDKGAPGGKANECDNVDDSPEQRTRVDNQGWGNPSCCGGAGYGKAPDHGEQVARRNETEDPAESRTDDKVSPNPKGGQNKFRIKIKLTGKIEPSKKGGKCQIVVTPSTEGHKLALSLPGGLQPDDNFCPIGFIHPAPGIRLLVPNNTGHTLVGLDVTPRGGLNITELSELDPQTGDKLNQCDLSQKTPEGACSLPLSEPVEPGDDVFIDATIAHFEPETDDSGLEIIPVTDDTQASTDWPGIKGVLVTFIPSGRNYGDIGDLVITNTTGRPVVVKVPEGLLLDSQDPAVQDLYVARVPTETACAGTEYVEKYITIAPEKSYVIKEVPGFCPDFELNPPAKDDSETFVTKKPDNKSKVLLATIKAAKEFDVGEVKLEVFEKGQVKEMVTQGACWLVDSKVDEVQGNEVSTEQLTKRFWEAFVTSSGEKLAKMTPEKRKEAEKLVREDLKAIVAATSFIAKKGTPG